MNFIFYKLRLCRFHIFLNQKHLSSHYELENAAWAENQGTRKESENYSDYCIKNLLDIFFKSSFLYLVILGTVSKEKLLYPKQKKHKRWNLASSDVTQILRPSRESNLWSCYWGLNGKEVPLLSTQATGWRQQVIQRAVSSVEASLSEWHASPGTQSLGTNHFVEWHSDVEHCRPVATGSNQYTR